MAVATLGIGTAVNAGRSAALTKGADVAAQAREIPSAVLDAAVLDTAAHDASQRTTAMVSRSERRTALSTEDLADVRALEVARKAAAAQAAQQARQDAEKAAVQKRLSAIADARTDPKVAARVLMTDHGWTSEREYTCLVNLWNGESDWRWWAENPSSGAYGIPQSLPAGKMAQFGADYRTNPLTQMKWGLWYIKMSYGTPCGAWDFWQSKMPHWY